MSPDAVTAEGDGVKHQWVLSALSGRSAAHVLAVLGLVSLLPGARLHFNDDDVPVLSWSGQEALLCSSAAEALVERTWDLPHGELTGIATTVPCRSAVNAMTSAAWDRAADAHELPTASVLATFDMSACKEGAFVGDVQVKAATLTLPSGKSYTSKCVQDTWDLLEAESAEGAHEQAAEGLAELLHGRIQVAAAKPGLRFSATQAAPRTTSGSELCDVQPLVDLLAFCGQLVLSPKQRLYIAGAERRAFAWVLNHMPLDLHGLLDVNAVPAPVLAWPRWFAPISSAGGGAKFSVLQPPCRLMPNNAGGYWNA